MKIGIFVDGDFIPSFDGASNRFHYLSRYLQKSGVEVVVFHGYRRWSDIELIKKEPFKTYCMSIDSYYNDLNFISSLINKEGVDLIQFDNLEPILIQGAKIAAQTNTHLVSDMHYCVSDLAKDLGATRTRIQQVRKAEELTGKFVDHVICINEVDAKKLVTLMSLQKNMISVVPSGIDLVEIECRDRAKASDIIFLGNLFFEPNEQAVRKIHRFIYPILSEMGYKFSIIGDYPESLKEELGNSNDFVFQGTISNLNQEFSKALVALAPIDGGTGMRVKILNYMGAGIPTIASSKAMSGLSDVKDIIVEDDINKYPDLIAMLANNRQKAAVISRSLRTQAESFYGWDSIASRVKDIYKEVLNKPIINKTASLHLLSGVNAKEPVWLEEAVQKKRFYAKYPEISDDCILIQGGKVNFIR